MSAMTEAQAEEIFRKMRWPDTDGEPVCPRCGSQKHYPLTNQKKFKCAKAGCRHQFSITSDTPFAHRKLSYKEIISGIRFFAMEAKGRTAIALSHQMGVTPKTAWVFQHKVREAFQHSMRGYRLHGTVEADGQWFGGYIRPENVKINRVDRTLAVNKNGKQRVVVAARERGENGRTVVNVFRQEYEARAWAAERIGRDATIMTDGGPGWLGLFASHEVRQVNHKERYALPDGTNTNQAESFFSRLRRMELGQHHHVAGPYLILYAADGAWRENNRRKDHRTRTMEALRTTLAAPQSPTFSGYWQRRGPRRLAEGDDFFANFT